MSVIAHILKVDVDGSPMDVYLAVPGRSARGPAIVLMYHRGGIDDFTKSVAQRLAEGGYAVAVPDVYHRCPAGIAPAERKNFLRDPEIVGDVQATLDALRARAEIDAGSIVVMGHCMGGRMALLAAGSLPGFRGVVVYYGGSVMRSWGDNGATPFDRLRNIRCPVIGFFGNQDTHPSPEDVDRIDAELTAHRVGHVFHRYPQVGHGFQNPVHDSPQERAAAEDAWTKTFAFLREVAPVHNAI